MKNPFVILKNPFVIFLVVFFVVCAPTLADLKGWILLIFFSALVGVICGFIFDSKKTALLFGAAIPWFGLLGILLYYEYFVPYQGGGASMWPVAQLFGGTVAAAAGALAAGFIQNFKKRGISK